MKSEITKFSLVTALCVACAWRVNGAEPGLQSPTANLTESWSNSPSGWLKKDILAQTSDCWSSGSLVVAKAPVNTDTPSTDYIFGATNSSGSRFAGDYGKMESICFDIMTTGLSTNPTFYFKTQVGVVWNYVLSSVPLDSASQWIKVTVPLSSSTGWKTGAYQPVFDNDKKNIVEIGIKTTTPKLTTQTQQVAVDNMKLVGPWGGPFTNGVSLAWLLENGLNLDQALKDSDGDGIKNEFEFYACTNPNDSNDVFRVEVARNAQGKTILKWKENNRYAKYDVLEGTDLNDPASFQGKTGLVDMQGSGLQKEAEVGGEAVTGPRFYKVQVRYIAP